MAENLFDQYANIPALSKQTADILKMFGEVKKGLMDLSKVGIKIDSAKGMADLNAQAKELEALQNRIADSQKRVIEQEQKLAQLNRQLAASYKETGDSVGQSFGAMTTNIQKQIDLTNKLKEVRAGIKKLEGFDTKIDSPELTAELTKLKEAEAVAKAELGDLNRYIRQQAKEFISAGDSVDGMRARVAQLTQTYDAADASFKQSEGGQALKKQINELNAALDKELSGTDRFNQRVGNYAASAKVVVDQLKVLDDQLSSLKEKQSTLNTAAAANPIGFKTSGQNEELQNVSAQIQNLTVQATALREVTNKPLFENAAGDVRNNKAQVDLLDESLKQLENTGHKDTETFRNLRTQMFQLLSQNQSAKILVNAFGEVEAKLTQLRDRQKELNGLGFKTNAQVQELQNLEKELLVTEKEFHDLEAVFNRPGFLAVASKVGDATSQIRFFSKALEDMKGRGLENTETYQQLQKEIAHLTDSMGDTRQEIKALSSDTRQFDLAASAIGTLASTFQTLASSAELFAGDNQEVAKSVQKLMAIQNISNGIRQIAKDITDKGTAANKAYVFVQNLVTTATNASATAAERWMAVLKGAGILALITALVWAADKMHLFGGETEKAADAAARLNVELEHQNAVLSRNIGALENANRRRIAEAKAAGKSEEEINNITLAGQIKLTSAYRLEYNKRLKDAYNFRDAEGTRLDVSIKNNGDYADQLYKINLKLGGKLSDEDKDRLEATKNYLQDLQTLQGNIISTTNAYGETILNNQTSVRKKQDEESKKRLEQIKKELEAERKAANDLANFRLEQAAQRKDAEKNLGVEGFSEEAATAAFALRKKVIENNYQFEIAKEGETASQIKLARAKKNAEIADLEAQLGADILLIKKNSHDKDLADEKQYTDMLEAKEKERVDNIQRIDEALLQHANDRADKEMFEGEKIAAEKFKAGTISEKEYQDEILRLQEQGQRKKLQSQINFYKGQIAIIKAAGGDTLALEKALAEAEAQLAQSGIAGSKNDRDQKKKDAEELAKTFITTTKTIFGAYQEVVQGFSAKQKQDIQDQIDNIDKLRQADIDRINQSTDSEEKKRERVAIIERKAQSDKEALARRQRQIDRQAAMFERAAKVFTITTDTIVTVNKIRAEAAAAVNPVIKAVLFAESFVAAAAGAASLVALLATPLPKYAKGGKPKEGLGIIAEEGREMVREKSGRVKLFTQPTLTKFAGDEYIYPNTVTEHILRKTSFVDHARNGGSVVVNLNQDEVVQELKKGNKKPPMTLVISDRIEVTPYYWNNIKW